ncbi:odorant receptor 131-2-like [Electrophorus electricus]|uniref:odorant receptor 131-2-like n=1 Tax=Electrophorus electricus TaxID=8005 RepID=UPI0015CFD229|nr:odorant receptor 131-2-like [Electrophorus electricus]
MCTAECNNSEDTNSSSYQLQLVSSMPMRIIVSMGITQFFVWPFIYINVLMLVTFSRKQAFRTETRYILFAHTLLVDLIFLLLTDFVVLISYSDVLMPMVFCIPFCILMEMVTLCTPLTITAMCVERYVAICMPLRHSALSTSSRTHTAILIIWIISAVKPLVDVIILASTVSQAYLSQLTYCYYEILTPEKWHRYMRGFLCIFNFIIILLVELFCYVMIMLAARAASVDEKSAAKGLRTVSLHMLQLTLCTMEIICPYIEAIVIQLDIQVYLSVRFFNFITFNVIARAVSPLVYGIRDEKFYTAFVYHMRCGQNHISSEHRQSNPAQK